MAVLVENCPRCGAGQMTFDMLHEHVIETKQYVSEMFCRCRNCNETVTFRVAQRAELEPILRAQFELMKALPNASTSLNQFLRVEKYVSVRDFVSVAPPEHCPSDINAVFCEGSKCLAIECFNAAGTMFRLCVDLATRRMLPPEATEGGPNAKQRRDLGLRLPWLLEHGLLPKELQELSHCIKEDGNDGAHAGTLKKEDAEDLLDFTSALLERVYTEPERLKLAKLRREQRRKAAAPAVRALPARPVR